VDPYNLTVMTGNVAQHIFDPEWERTLTGNEAVMVFVAKAL
jgi:hypothetical protein